MDAELKEKYNRLTDELRKMKKAALHNLGCKVNSYETEDNADMTGHGNLKK